VWEIANNQLLFDVLSFGLKTETWFGISYTSSSALATSAEKRRWSMNKYFNEFKKSLNILFSSFVWRKKFGLWFSIESWNLTDSPSPFLQLTLYPYHCKYYFLKKNECVLLPSAEQTFGITHKWFKTKKKIILDIIVDIIDWLDKPHYICKGSFLKPNNIYNP